MDFALEGIEARIGKFDWEINRHREISTRVGGICPLCMCVYLYLVTETWLDRLHTGEKRKRTCGWPIGDNVAHFVSSSRIEFRDKWFGHPFLGGEWAYGSHAGEGLPCGRSGRQGRDWLVPGVLLQRTGEHFCRNGRRYGAMRRLGSYCQATVWVYGRFAEKYIISFWSTHHVLHNLRNVII